MNNNFDIEKSAGVSDGTSLDKFFNMQGRTTFLTAEDLLQEVPDNIEVLHEGYGLSHKEAGVSRKTVHDMLQHRQLDTVLYGDKDEQGLVKLGEEIARGVFKADRLS